MLATIASLPLLASCGSEPTGAEAASVGVTESSLYYRSTSLWDQRDIPVCWEDSGFAQEKGWVKEALRGQRSWSSQANVNFVGWGDCTSGSKGIRIEAGTQMRTFSLGQVNGTLRMELDFSAHPETNWTRCISNGLNRRDCIATVALHEFGHALSFAHEQNRSDTPSSCKSRPQGTDGDTTFASWDPVSIMNYCGGASELSGRDLVGTDFVYGGRYRDAPRAGDFNGDGRDDMLCHQVVSGHKWIDLADGSGRFGSTDWSRAANWCRGDNHELLKGDFNGDGRSDLLCHDSKSGRKWVDYADGAGRFNGTEQVISSGWCQRDSQRLLIGDFNGDGRDDLLCHDVAGGTRWIDYADSRGRFGGTDWYHGARWCRGDHARLRVGDFNGDRRDDLLCHDVAHGRKWISYAKAAGRFGGTDWGSGARWCPLDSARLLIGDFNGDRRDDLLCHDVVDGHKWIDYADSLGHFGGTDWSRNARWCSQGGGRLSVGDFDGDGRDDMLCHGVASGSKWIDFADGAGHFNGTDWGRAVNWCRGDGGELH